MWNVSGRYLITVARSHQVDRTLRVEVDDGPAVEVAAAATSGTIRQDGDALIRWSMRDLRIVDPTADLVAAGFGDALAAPSQIRVSLGVVVDRWEQTTRRPAPEVEWVPCGTFRVADHHVDVAPDTLEVSTVCYDRMRDLQRSRWPHPYPVADGTLCDVAVRSAILDRVPDANVVIVDPTTETTAAVTLGPDPDHDPATAVQDLAASYGRSVHVDRLGRFVIEPTVDPGTRPVRTLPVATLRASRTLTDEPGWNGVVGTAEGPHLTSPLVAEVWDDDPESPTRREVWGEVPRFWSTPLAKNQNQLNRAVASLFATVRGGREQLTATMVGFPPLDVGDVVELDDDRAKIAGAWTVQSVDLPFEGPMTVTFHERQAS